MLLFIQKERGFSPNPNPTPILYLIQHDFDIENPFRNHLKRSRRPSTSSTDRSLLDQTDIMDLDHGHNPLDGAQVQGSNSSESF